ncbi:uncharacterized protein DUF4861 [Mangrovibacterium marinum]|uniref:Uncharacterized protein DUF4861 n=1 Tax=Mangrovibacterium marinum TaxID=1639118 RepID=A0A2T5C377_9BACT|nr:DUF4861 domain-containing protein [Mangrovibacterium marinum]PTN09221.1 uncharacterized protein DUF4861 [Mangrovibacterium marinum]
MKRNLLIALAATTLLFGSCAKEKQLVVENPIDRSRTDELLVLDRQQIDSSFPAPEAGMLPLVLNGNDTLASQVDDLDGDGTWDELAFLVNFQPNEKLTLQLAYVPADAYPRFEKRTNMRLGIEQEDGTYKEVDYYRAPSASEPFKIIAQGESVSWENDKMGFRTYFDCRNVKDLFGKLKPGLIIDKIHTPAMGSYHQLADWGMDVLHCGNSLGSGGLAMLENDSLYRLGSTETYEYQKITEGPVRSVCELKYGGWKVADQNLAAVERISVFPGKYWFQSDVTVSGFEGQKQLVTGIVTSYLTTEPEHFKANADYDAIATLDQQSENKDELGMAVVLKADEVTTVARSTDVNYFDQYPTVPEKGFSNVISETYYVAQKISNDNPARHYFAAVWGLENPEWKEMANFKAYLSSEAEKWSNPIVVTIQ